MTDRNDEREKLLRARAEIVETLKRYGLVGHVAMASQLGLSEAVMHLEAPWCKAFVQETPQGQAVRLRSLRSEYSDAQTKREHLESTISAVGSVGELAGMCGVVLLEVHKRFIEYTGAIDEPLRPDPPQ